MRQIAFAAILLTLLPPSAQQIGAQQPPPSTNTEGAAKFTSSTQLLVATVIVKDKAGNPVEGLTAKDFIITEDGKPQTVAFCEYQKLVDPGPNSTSALIPRGDPNTGTVKVDAVTRGQIAPEQPGKYPASRPAHARHVLRYDRHACSGPVAGSCSSRNSSEPG